MHATQGRAGIDPAAHDAYLVGLQYLSRRNTADINRAIAYFKRAIHADPDYADAWAGVAVRSPPRPRMRTTEAHDAGGWSGLQFATRASHRRHFASPVVVVIVP
ncbi:MAG: hypothetical protein ACREPK_08340 [Rhodanobacteraceae bacterium]